LKRVEAFEVALFSWLAHYEAQIHDAPPGHEASRLPNDPDSLHSEPELDDTLTVGRMFETLLSQDLASKLSRYETSMQRHAFRVARIAASPAGGARRNGKGKGASKG